MSGLVDALAIFAVVVLMIVRQFRAQRISSDRRWWILPAVLGFIALREPGVIDPHHQAEAILLLGVELLIGLATGAGWAWTTRIWTAPDGSVWGQGTKASAVVWIVGIGLRVGLFGIGALLGVHQDATAMVLVALAATLLVRSGILAWRSQSLHPASRRGAAYGDGVARAPWKERV
ncbi:DUF1453 domain-containing protein [Streptomyces sp. NBC_00038]|uniref:DUF1453 domain-containing protein n=1 Tax=Streptomyces sp. NBC_00038 TaxID=2903615 RepID=UPI002256E876|nr:DUF1453 domain-containing protein [Streptomyces sp. NBC_00038]MCX5561332.1 DUF1453 domain-containing protein [Streptomyces sp. NBC_00038]